MMVVFAGETDMSALLQPLFDAIGLGDADTRHKVLYAVSFIASAALIHFACTSHSKTFLTVSGFYTFLNSASSY